MTLDKNWLWAVLRFAKKNPDLFPTPAKDSYVLDENDVEDFVNFCKAEEKDCC